LQNYNLAGLADSMQKCGLLDLITRMIVPATRRASIPEIISHPWFRAFAPPEIQAEIAKFLGSSPCEDARAGDAKIEKTDQGPSSASAGTSIVRWTGKGCISIRPPSWTHKMTKDQVLACYNKMRGEWRRSRMKDLHDWLIARLGISEREATDFLWWRAPVLTLI